MRYSFHAATFHAATAHSTAARVGMAVCCCTLLSGLAGKSAHADAVSEGNVVITSDGGATYTADNPLTGINEGIPTGGNTINENQGLNNQLNFEGRTDTKGTATTADDENINFDIIVGRTSYGLLTINAGTELRDMTMIIGASGTVAGSPIVRRGTGYVVIENPGSLYNNDPNILPFPFDETGVSPSINDRIDEPGADLGFDLCVGHTGSGDMTIRLGGRAEIQDAVFVGDESGGVGTLTIDGVSSFLQSGGFETDSSDPNEVHYMIVGRFGSGTMSITNGGQSYNSGAISTTSTEQLFGAVIGSNLAAETTAAPAAGGQGTVYVDGIGSKWTVAGNLQVGGFHDNRVGVFPLAQEDLEGNSVIYGSSVGRGTLKVSNGALVSIVTPPTDAGFANVPERLDLLIGHFGRVELDGGRIELLGVVDGADPEDPEQELFRGALINDGVVTGHGSISVLQFRNRVLGEVSVGAGQSLIVEATGPYAQPDNFPVNTEPEEYPLSNYGVIKVLGTVDARAQIEFDRNQTNLPLPTDITRPFLNLPVTGLPIAPGGRTEGLIHGEFATMQFKSGIENRGVVAFTAGDNVVSGDFFNKAESVLGAGDDGQLLIGPNTNVAFEDDLIIEDAANFSISPTGSFQVLKGNSFKIAGNLNLVVAGSSQGLTFETWQIAGNATVSGILDVTITNGLSVPLGSAVTLFDFGGSIIGNFSQVNVFGSPLDFYTYGQNGKFFLASFLPPPAGSGPDLNGDGIVDIADHAVWKQNFGTAGPAGDANGDGVVNILDYSVWRDNCCGPFPGAGSGSGLGLGAGIGGAVPEPTSAFLLVAGVLALAAQRRRRS